MIEVSLGREDIKGWFREDIGVVSILGWEDNITFLGSNGEFGGQGSSSNMFVIE